MSYTATSSSDSGIMYSLDHNLPVYFLPDFVIIDDISGSQSLSPVDQMGGESHRRSSQFSFRSSSPDGSASAGNETDLIFRHCKFHLRLVRAALINLLAFRVYRFVVYNFENSDICTIRTTTAYCFISILSLS